MTDAILNAVKIAGAKNWEAVSAVIAAQFPGLTENQKNSLNWGFHNWPALPTDDVEFHGIGKKIIENFC